jgi:hypothetical protein
MARRARRVGEQRFGHHDCPRELIFGAAPSVRRLHVGIVLAAGAVNAVDPQTGEA